MAKKALIIVDPQNDFFNLVPNSSAIIKPINQLIKNARQLKWVLVASQDWHSPDLFAHNPSKAHCLKNTIGADFHPLLTIDPSKFTIIKKGENSLDKKYYSAFSSDHLKLHDILKKSDVTSVTIVGLTTNYCVQATALDALKYGYEVAIVRQACAANFDCPEDEDRYFKKLAKSGVFIIDKKIKQLII